MELMVTVGVISVLTTLLLPAVMTAREAARRIECTNHLRQIGLAIHNYHDAYASLPTAWQYHPSGRTAYAWGVSLLPFVEQRTLFDSINTNSRLSDHCNAKVRARSIELFRCPSDVAPVSFALFESGSATPYLTLPSANYVGVYGTWEPDDIHPTPPGDGTFINAQPVRFSDVTRGLSQTFLIGERSEAMFPSSWIGFDRRDKDAECRVVGSALNGPNCLECDECEFSSRHAGVSEFLFGDGHVCGISNSIDLATYRQMARRHE